MQFMRTKGDVLRFAISFALIKVKVARHRLGLTDEMRAEIASDAVRYILKTGQWKELNDITEHEVRPFPSLDSKTRL